MFAYQFPEAPTEHFLPAESPVFYLVGWKLLGYFQKEVLQLIAQHDALVGGTGLRNVPHLRHPPLYQRHVVLGWNAMRMVMQKYEQGIWQWVGNLCGKTFRHKAEKHLEAARATFEQGNSVLSQQHHTTAPNRMLFEVKSEVGTTAEAYQQRQVSVAEGER